jgi:dolichol-phosphate mannosyltransferase
VHRPSNSMLPDPGPLHSAAKIAVVIPCYRVTAHINAVIRRIGCEVQKIYVVDDCCPERSGDHVQSTCDDPRIRVIFHPKNLGVGGATITGYRQAMQDGATVVVKVDGDGQMDPNLLPSFILPILRGEADYTKGNRFYYPADLRSMPRIRLLGNAILSFMSKLSSGYWSIFDPTNGYTAIHVALLRTLPLEQIDERYFFESDMLFRLNLLRAKILDVPMKAVYADETSGVSISRAGFEFLAKHCSNFMKRLVYSYFLRDFSLASLELIAGAALVLFGTIFGLYYWYHGIRTGIPASSGTVMLSALPIFLGIQFLLNFLSFDIANQPDIPINPRLSDRQPADQGVTG